jgi:porin-like protein
MARRIFSAKAPTAPARAACHVIAAILLFAVPASGAAAQTLTDPAPPAKWSPLSKAAKSQAEHAKACSSFGPGFVNVPGTDACVKIGGWVTVEGSARR